MLKQSIVADEKKANILNPAWLAVSARINSFWFLLMKYIEPKITVKRQLLRVRRILRMTVT
jgi:hypothetical protein